MQIMDTQAHFMIYSTVLKMSLVSAYELQFFFLLLKTSKDSSIYFKKGEINNVENNSFYDYDYDQDENECTTDYKPNTKDTNSKYLSDSTKFFYLNTPYDLTNVNIPGKGRERC